MDAVCSSRLLAKMRRYWSTNVTYCRGVPPTARCIAHICSTTSASSSASLASNASCSRVRGTARMPTSLHPSIQCTEHLVNSAGFASVRAAHSASAGSMLSAMCSLARTRAVKNSNGLSIEPSAIICSLSGPNTCSSSAFVNRPGTSPLESNEFTVSRMPGVTSWWSSRYRSVSLCSRPTSASTRFRSARNARSS